MKEKRYTLWLCFGRADWQPTITVSGRTGSKTGRQLLEDFRRTQYGDECWKGHTRILPEGKAP